MRLDEIRIDWSGFADHAKEMEAKDRLYDVVVANPKLGSYRDGTNMSYREARRQLVNLANEHFSDIFRDDPQGIEQEWQNYDAVKVKWSTTGSVTFYYLRDVTEKK